MSRRSSTSHRSSVRRLAAARAISIAGGEAAYIAMVSLVLTRTHSAAWVSVVLLVWIGIGGLMAPFAGALGDRFDRRRVMIASDLAGAAAFALLAFAHSPTAVVILAAIAAIAEAPFFPAATASIPNLTPEADLAWANGLIGAGRTFGALVGPVAGGVLIASVGAGAAFLVNAASFALSAALVATVHGRFNTDRVAGRPDLLAGFRVVRRSPLLRSLAVAWSVFLVGVGFVLVAELPLAHALGSGSVGYGLIVAGWGAGGLIGSVCARHVVAALGEQAGILVGTAAAGLAIAAVAIAPTLVAAIAVLTLAGLANSVSSVSEETLVQRVSEDSVRSRVLAAQEAIWIAALGVGLGVGGQLVAALGPRAAYGIAGSLAVAAAGILSLSLRRTHAATAPA